MLDSRLQEDVAVWLLHIAVKVRRTLAVARSHVGQIRGYRGLAGATRATCHRDSHDLCLRAER